MATATFRHGEPLMIDHVAAADITAGDIIIVGNGSGLTNVVAHLDIANGATGSAAAGGGVYLAKVAGNYAKGTKVFADPANTAAALTSTSTNMSLFGFTEEAAAAANDFVEVIHDPRV
jgi:predicted RecA/RadA family phage recombinase